jgi:hypothetical protein
LEEAFNEAQLFAQEIIDLPRLFGIAFRRNLNRYTIWQIAHKRFTKVRNALEAVAIAPRCDSS